MAKKKLSSKDKAKLKPKRRPWWVNLLRFVLLPPGLYFILVVAIGAIVYWQWSPITSWVDSIVEATWRLFGWGLIFIAVAVITLISMIWLRKVFSAVRRWNYWLGGTALILAIWGILGFFAGEGILRQASLGGDFGLGIIGYPDLIGGLRLLGLVVLGIILIAPGACYRLVAKTISWLGKRFKRQPSMKPAPQQKPQVPSAGVASKSPVLEPERRAVAPVMATAPAPQELKQVAQEVWKKYGESPSLVTVDGWRLPPIDILDRSPEIEFSQADNVQRARLIEEALASYGVDSKVVQINEGPTVTQFGVEPGWDRKTKEVRERDRDGNMRVRSEEVSKTRVKVERITSLANDLALALAAPSIRLEAPVPGQSVVGIEVPNTISGLVSLRGVIETSAFQKMQAKSKLGLALGKGTGGEAVAGDLMRMPHLLIAGATGSGKTVCLNSLICCLLLNNTPYDVRFIMIDPKRVELTPFNSIPHLAAPVIVDSNKALEALRWLSQEMDKRYQKLATAASRNIEGYNKDKQGEEKMPFLVLIIDELADLMMAGGDEVEHSLCRLAQLSRAVGIHLVVATQRPSVDVITGLIKANIPTRISFAVTSQVDSRTILDGGGAEKLLGKGDMLYMPTEAGKPKRLQGCYVSDAETERLVYFWGSQRQEQAAPLKINEFAAPRTAAGRLVTPEDPMLVAARKLARDHEHISTSFLQRRLRIGYPRAARIMEQLEEEGARGEEEGEREGEAG